MDQEQKDFILSAPLGFIASRNHSGHLDVSPRGGQPSVLWLGPHGRLCFPDYAGNRRLDTLGNVLADPEVAFLLVKDGVDRFVRFNATAEISTDPEVLRHFPADENPALSAMVLTPDRIETVETDAFVRAGFWVGPKGRKPNLDALGMVNEDRAHFDRLGLTPVLKDRQEEIALEQAGLRTNYGAFGAIVREKVTARVGPGTLRLLDEVELLVAAHVMNGRLQIDLVAEGTPAVQEQGSVLQLPMPRDATFGQTGELGILAMAPGRVDVMRLNGRYRTTNRDLLLSPREVYLHCAASLSRSFIWQDRAAVPWTGRRRFICTGVTQEAPNVASFQLRADDLAPVGNIAPGQYVSVALPADDGGIPRRRSYSVSGRPDPDSLRITVRRIGKGGLSDALHDRIGVGDPLHLGAPAGHFVLDSAPFRPVVLVSAGVGITPMLPMLAALAVDPSARDVWFIHGARNAGHHPFKEEVAAIIRNAPHLRATVIAAYSRPAPTDRPDHKGRIDAGMLARLVDPAKADFYICGPTPFMDDLRQGLGQYGAQDTAIRSEAFEAAQADAAVVAALAARPRCTVTFRKSGKSVSWSAQSGTLLDLAVANGVDVPHSCRIGDCRSCLQRILSGHADHPALKSLPLAKDQALLCQAYPDGDVTLDC